MVSLPYVRSTICSFATSFFFSRLLFALSWYLLAALHGKFTISKKYPLFRHLFHLLLTALCAQLVPSRSTSWWVYHFQEVSALSPPFSSSPGCPLCSAGNFSQCFMVSLPYEKSICFFATSFFSWLLFVLTWNLRSSSLYSNLTGINCLCTRGIWEFMIQLCREGFLFLPCNN